MKVLKYFLSTLLVVAAIWSCTDDDFGSTDFISTAAVPGNLAALFQVTQDNTGKVTITPTGESTDSYLVYFGDITAEPAKVNQGSSVTHIYREGSYTVKIIGTNLVGEKTETTLPLVVSFKAPQNLVVEIENDKAVSKKVNVKVNADYAILFDVHFGEPGNDAVISANIGGTASYTYKEAGTYTIKVVAKGAAIKTTEKISEFVVTAISQPIQRAPIPESRIGVDVVSIYSHKYTNIGVSEWNPGWGQSTVLSTFTVDGDDMLKYDFLNYTGIVTDYGNPTNLSAMEFVRFDYWTNDAGNIAFKIVNTSEPAGPTKESEVNTVITEFGKWKTVEIPLSQFTTNMSKITQLVLSSNGNTIFIDNIYFYRKASLMIHDDFEGNGNITTWSGDSCGLNTAFANPFKTGINTSNTVLEYSDDGGQYANIRFDTPANFDLTTKNKFTLKIYVPSTSVTGDSPKQISLKLQNGTAGAPWETQTEIIKTIVYDAWQTITFDFANDTYINWWSITQAPIVRTDLNRVVLQVNAENNNNKVKAYIDDFNYHN